MKYPLRPIAIVHPSSSVEVRAYLLALDEITGYADDEGVRLAILVVDGGEGAYGAFTQQIESDESVEAMVERFRATIAFAFPPN